MRGNPFYRLVSPAWIGTLVLVGFLLASQACGYRFAGGGSLPAGIERLYIPTVQNRSAETGIETTVTNALVEEATRYLKAQAGATDTADGVLLGEITRIATTTVSRSGERTAAERRVEIEMRLRLEDASARELRRIEQLRADRVYDVIDGDEIATEANRQRALAEAAQDLAERAYQRLTDDF
ncbi:MAG: LPS assembly lipoprotein LptE [Desulfosarcinaceae bacterium]|nr:LPS assembly lipoprotein LptE [Desulfosarcinaceae bacterium]